jgi:hypothetical protein
MTNETQILAQEIGGRKHRRHSERSSSFLYAGQDTSLFFIAQSYGSRAKFLFVMRS